MRQVRFDRRFACLTALGAVAAVIAMAGCGGDEEVTGPVSSGLVLDEATLKASGESIGGQTIRMGENNGTIRFEARLVDHRGNPAPSQRVRVEFNVPGMGMMHRTGSFMLHDDGTHGDLMPHDGVYCYEDAAGEYGCHGSNAQPGEYHYEFCGVGPGGHETNRIGVQTVLTR